MTDLSMRAPPLQSEFRVGHVFGRAWDIFAANFIKFTIVTAIIAVPNIVLFATTSDVPGTPSAGSGLRVFLGLLLGITLNMLAQAVILYLAFQHLRGQDASLGDAVQKCLGRVLPIIGVFILAGLGVSLGLLLLIIPGLMLVARWAVAAPACVVERLGPLASLSRSAALTKGHRWKIFGIFLLISLGSMVIGMLFGLLSRPLGAIATVLVSFAWTAIWTAYFNSVWVMIYHDLRVAKEGVDVEQIAAVFD